jgi:hypothetical protein
MKYSILIFIVFVSASFVSCSNLREKMVGEISKMESEMKSSQKVDSVSVTELKSAYQNFSSKFPNDSLTPEYLYKAVG